MSLRPSQWPEIERGVTVLPGRGYQHLLTKEEAIELRASLGNKFKVLVHRDRDSLTDDEVIALKADYDSEGIRLWVTDQSDLEAEFCDAGFLSSLTGDPLNACETLLEAVLIQDQTPIKEQFVAQRAAHNAELHKAGGSPPNADVWAAFQGRPLKGAKGKTVFKRLKNKVPANKFSEATVLVHDGYPERAASLKANLEDLLA